MEVKKPSEYLELNKIHMLDNQIALEKMPDDYVDLTITSPPYNLGKSFRSGQTVNMYEGFSDDLPQEEYKQKMDKLITELIRVTKRYVFFNFQMLTNNKLAYLEIMGKYKENIKDVLIWHKKQFQPAISPTCLSSQFEFIIIFSKKTLCKKRSFETAYFNNLEKGGATSNVIYGNNSSIENNGTSNKATFPRYLVRWIIEKFTKKGDIVLDPHMGTGTVAVVCNENNRRFIGYEIIEEYNMRATQRLQQKTLLQALGTNFLTPTKNHPL